MAAVRFQPRFSARMAAARPMSARVSGIVVEGFERIRPVLGMVPLHQQPGPAMADGPGQAAHPRAHHGGSAGLRFNGHQPKGLAVGGHHHNVRGPEPGRQLRRADRRKVRHDVVHVRLP